MSDSVAGRIRIDILANVAKFSADMRQAGREGLKSFNEEFEKNRGGFNTQKAIGERINREKDAWKSAMMDARRETESLFGKNRYDTLAFNNLGRMNATYNLAEDRRIRLRNLLPFGMSTMSELSSQDAAYAAAMGAEDRLSGPGGGGRGMLSRLRPIGRILSSQAMGPLRGLGMATEDFSAATKGLGVFSAALIASHTLAANLGREITTVREEAIRLGMTYDQLVQKRGLEKYSRFTEGAALASTKSMPFVKKGAANIMGGVMSLFGGDPEAIADQTRQEERAEIGLKKYNKAQEGIDGLNNRLNSLKMTSEQLEKIQWIQNFSPTPEQIRRWDQLSLEIAKAKIAKEREDRETKSFVERETKVKGMFGQMQDRQDRLFMGDEKYQREQFRKGLHDAGVSPMEEASLMNRYTRMAEEAKRKEEEGRREKLRGEMAKSVRTPLERYQDDLSELSRLFPGGGETFNRRRKQLRDEAVSGLAGESPSINLAPSMELGSREAYSVIAQASVNDPKIAEAKQTNAKLDAIDRKLGLIAAAAGAGNPFNGL